MNLATPSTLLLAAVVTSPAFYDAFVTGEMDVSTALLRYLVGVVVCGIMLACLRGLTNGYQDQRRREEDAEQDRRLTEEYEKRKAAVAEAAAAAAAAAAAPDDDDDDEAGQYSGGDRRRASN